MHSLRCSLQLRYGRRWAPMRSNNPLLADTADYEIEIYEDEFIGNISFQSAFLVDSIQFNTTMRSLPRIGADKPQYGKPIVAGEILLYFRGSVCDSYDYAPTNVQVFHERCLA